MPARWTDGHHLGSPALSGRGRGLSLGLPASLRGHSRGSTGAAVRFGGSARGWLEPSSVALVAVGRSAGRCPGASRDHHPSAWGCINLSSPSPISWWLRCWWVSWRPSRLGVLVPSSPPVLPSSLTTPLWRLAMADATVAALPTREQVVPSRKRIKLPPWLEVAKPRLIPLLLATTVGGMALSEGWPLASPRLVCTLGRRLGSSGSRSSELSLGARP